MRRIELPPGWWGVFDCERCGLSVPVERLSDALALEPRHGFDRCKPYAERHAAPRAVAGTRHDHPGDDGGALRGPLECYGQHEPRDCKTCAQIDRALW